MSEAFKDRTTFNEDISGWDVSSVNSMARMFYGASAFNQPIGNWDMSNVTSLQGMFQASTFNQSIGEWNVSSVTQFASMFSRADAFNQDIGDWNTSSATHMDYMFYLTKTFNQNIGGWDISSVVKVNGLFWGAKVFDQDISDWNFSSVSKFGGSFSHLPSLSDTNKGLIHKSFSSNPNWTYDWGVYANSAPVDLNASAPLVIMENEPIGRVVGIFAGSDPDANSTLRYSIPDSNKSNAPVPFTMEENGTLLSARMFDYETDQAALHVLVRVSDEYNATFDKNFSISLTNQNEKPYDLSTSAVLHILEGNHRRSIYRRGSGCQYHFGLQFGGW